MMDEDKGGEKQKEKRYHHIQPDNMRMRTSV